MRRLVSWTGVSQVNKSKWSEEDIDQLRELYGQCLTAQEIADEMGRDLRSIHRMLGCTSREIHNIPDRQRPETGQGSMAFSSERCHRLLTRPWSKSC